MTCYRANTHVLSLHRETAFGTRNAAFDADKEGIPAWDITAVPQRAVIEDKATRQSLGHRPPTLGVDFMVGEIACSTYVTGLGLPLIATPLTHLLEATCGAAASSSAADATAGVPTATAVQLAVGAGYVTGNLYITPFNIAARGAQLYPRPAIVTEAVPGTKVLDLYMALPAAPAAADLIHACVNVGCVEQPSAGVSLQGDVLGMIPADGWEFYGAGGGNVSIPPLTPDAAQEITFTNKVARFVSPAVAATRVSPGYPHHIKPSAGAELLIAAFGSTVVTRMDQYRIGIETGREYIWSTISGIDNPLGVQGWCLTEQKVTASVVVHVDDAPPAALTGATWREVFELQENIQLFAGWGAGESGEMFSAWMPKMHLEMDPEHGDTDGIATLTLTFVNSESLLPPLHFSQS